MSDQVRLVTCYVGISLDNFHAYSTVSLGSKASKRIGAIFFNLHMRFGLVILGRSHGFLGLDNYYREL